MIFETSVRCNFLFIGTPCNPFLNIVGTLCTLNENIHDRSGIAKVNPFTLPYLDKTEIKNFHQNYILFVKLFFIIKFVTLKGQRATCPISTLFLNPLSDKQFPFCVCCTNLQLQSTHLKKPQLEMIGIKIVKQGYTSLVFQHFKFTSKVPLSG